MRREPGAEPGTACAEYSLNGDPGSVREGLCRMLLSAPLAGLDAATRGAAEIVLAEVMNNIVEHAYGAGGGPIRLCMALRAEGLCCRIEDRGRPMPGGCLPAGQAPDPAAGAEGGYGWFLIRTLAANLGYAREGGVNRITFLLPRDDQVRGE